MTETHIEVIRTAIAEGAGVEARAAGANACRALLAVLEPPLPPTAPALNLPVAAIASAIRSMPPGQLAEILIAKLRTLVPVEAQAAPAHKFNIPLVPVPTP